MLATARAEYDQRQSRRSSMSGARPFLKWPGGKGQLLPQYRRYYPPRFGRYYEPFVGGGALFFDLQPRRAHLSDLNHDLVNVYTVVRDKVDELIVELESHPHDEAHFYRVRAWDRPDENGVVPLEEMSDVARAARFILLNRTAYNGLVRYNRNGQYNAPFGKYKNPTICNRGLLQRASAALQTASLRIADFQDAVAQAGAGDFVFFDPPYMPLSPTASFTAYTGDSFGMEQHEALADLFRTLHRRGVHLMLANSDTPQVRALYDGFNISTVRARRNINCKGKRRGKIAEVLVTNYDTGNATR